MAELPAQPAAAAAAAAAHNDEWPTDPAQYEMIGKIGQGAFATVYKARRQKARPDEGGGEGSAAAPADDENNENTGDDDDRLVCAVKVLNLDHMDTNLAEIRSEVQAMRLLSHPNVLTCHAAFVADRNLWVVTPLMRKGSSLHSLQSARRALKRQQREAQLLGSAPGASTSNKVNMEPHLMYILHETLLGLQYIHQNGQIHRDIKGGNLLLDSTGHVCIADFGVSGFLVHAGSQQEKAKTFVGTPAWMAPEVMEQVHGYDYKADLWSLGITALELAKGYAPYAKYPPMKVLILTIQEDPPSLASYDEETDEYDDEVTDEYSKEFSNFVGLCLQKNPAKRATCAELLASKHFAAFQDDTYRQARREAIQNEICDIVRDVGYKQEEALKQQGGGKSRALPGNVPVFLEGAQDRRQAGTTWVFADGSQVVKSGTEEGAEVDDVMAELDDFGRRTGGEHYDRSNINEEGEEEEDEQEEEQEQQQQQQQEEDSHTADELDEFMDEFELNTGGEDFRRDA
jgi:serine/threonine-protein kinase OSR1/STK39